MSWEEDSRRKHPCACGKGTWDEVTRSDDWNRSESYAEINCEVCKRTHRIEATHGHDEGMPTSSYRLVPISK
ncbi:MAG: hypothetical protein IT434_07870 [Phycisphaerales bacterium]|jgi:hypothetical protein|nr:hypothetical protein [Phycisphaerales bacterium]